MYKYNSEKSLPLSKTFFKDWSFFQKPLHFSVLAQMPSRQLNLFLDQAYCRKETVTIQINKGPLCSYIREEQGVILSVSPNGKRYFLSSGNKVSIIEKNEIRHIRLTK